MPNEATAEATKTETVKEKVDQETEETLTEIVARAETAAKRWKYAEASNAYRRAAKLASGDEAKTLNGLADQMEAQAKEKGQPMSTKKKEKKIKAKSEKKAKAPKAAKAPKVKKAPKAKGDPKHKYPATPAEKRAAAERTAAFKKASGKREEASEKEAKVLAAFGGKDKDKTITELGEKSFPNKPKAIQKSWARNALRWIVNSKHAKKVGKGTYRRTA
jgi:hypothetical protein